MQARWFNNDGSVKEQVITEADVYTLIAPSLRRALTLNKAYMSTVQDQDFIHGRDVTITPASNVYNEVDPDTAPVLPAEKLQQWDVRSTGDTGLLAQIAGEISPGACFRRCYSGLRNNQG